LPVSLQETSGFFSEGYDQSFTPKDANKHRQFDQDIAWFKGTRFGTHNFKFGYQYNQTSNDVYQRYSAPYLQVFAGAGNFFQPGGDVEKIAPGSVVLVTPFSSKESTDAMYWQATANYRFRMPEGDAFTPGPYLGPHPSFMKSTLDDLEAGKPVNPTPEVLAMFKADLAAHGITAIVAGPSKGQAAIVEFLAEVEGSPPADDGGVKVWWQVK